LEKASMGKTMEDEIKLWTAKFAAAFVMEITQGKTSISKDLTAFSSSVRLPNEARCI
jgi:hypothetical protein